MEHDDTREPHQMSRRGLVLGVAGGAAVGAVAIASTRSATQASATSEADSARVSSAALTSAVSAASAQAAAGEPLVVHVRDIRSGALDLYSGTRHITVNDKDLAARLAALTA